jgi:hypothetical protein
MKLLQGNEATTQILSMSRATSADNTIQWSGEEI